MVEKWRTGPYEGEGRENMGMRACHMEADQNLIEELKTKSEEDLFEAIEKLEEEGEHRVYYLDKMWDGLHYILTGVSATAPIRDHLLSEAVVGTAMFSEDESADFISYIYPERVREISSALEMFDIDGALSDFSPRNMTKNDIYPAIWHESEKDSLREELAAEFHELKVFFSDMASDGKGIVISIY